MADSPETRGAGWRRFGRRLRLRRAREFRAVYDARVSTQSGPLVVYARPNGLGHLRLGLSVPRRAGNAVARNRIKRRVREAFRTGRHELTGGYDVVVNVRAHEPLATTEYGRRLARAIETLHRSWSSRRKAGDGTGRPGG